MSEDSAKISSYAEPVVTVLHVEDDEVDRRAVKRAFKKIGFDNPAYEASSGPEALGYLRGETGAIPKPRMVLLDLRMAGMDGHDFLKELRADSDLSSTVVFILTTSDNEIDRKKAHDQNVAAYLLKKESNEEFLKNMKLICDYVRQVRFPRPD